MSRRAVFLDRDGTLNVERGCVPAPEHLELLPGVADAVERLVAHGFAPVVVTNQSGIARGLYDEADLARIHARLQDLLGGRIRGFFHCPHHPEGELAAYRRACRCRKPAPGLLEQATATLGLDRAGSWLVGDAARDVLAAQAFGVPAILVECGKDAASELEALRLAGRAPEAVVRDLAAAVDLVLRDARPASPRRPPRGRSSGSAN